MRVFLEIEGLVYEATPREDEDDCYKCDLEGIKKPNRNLGCNHPSNIIRGATRVCSTLRIIWKEVVMDGA